MLNKFKSRFLHLPLAGFALLLAVLFLNSATCYAQSLEKQQWNYFEGKIGNEDARLAFYFEDNGAVKGSFCYRKEQTKIPFTGMIQPGEISFSTGSKAGFVGNLVNDNNQDKIAGTYYVDDSAKMGIPFKLKLMDYGEGSATKMYPVFESSDEKVEAFVKLAVKSILADDKAWIMDHLDFPFLWWNNTDWSSYNVREEQVKGYYPKIFNARFKERLKSAYIVNLSHGQFGVTLGNGDNGLLTILCHVDPTTKMEKFVITSIDCPDEAEVPGADGK